MVEGVVAKMKPWPHPRDEFLERWKKHIPTHLQDQFKGDAWELYEAGKEQALSETATDNDYDGDGA